MKQLDDLEPRLLDAESQIRSLVDDPEADMLLATVAGLRTRHVTLESQAKRYKQKIQVRPKNLYLNGYSKQFQFQINICFD